MKSSDVISGTFDLETITEIDVGGALKLSEGIMVSRLSKIAC